MAILIVWFVIWGLVCGAIAANRGRSFGVWFLVGALISPLAIIVLLSMPNLTVQTAAQVAVAQAQNEAENAKKLAEQAVHEKRLLELKVASPPADTRECPRCAETIKAAAKVCRFCGADLAATPSP